MTHGRRVAVTGIGWVTPLGSEVSAVWQRLLEGCSAVAPIRAFDASGFPVRIAAEVPTELEAADACAEGWPRDRIGRFALTASLAAWRDALPGPGMASPERRGLQLAVGIGSFEHREVFAPFAAALEGAFDPELYRRASAQSMGPWAAERRSPGNLVARVARRLGCAGPVMAVDTACAAGAQAVGGALQWIRRGEADLVVAGGADSQLSPLGLASFCLLRVLSTRNDDPQAASRPFDAGRDGFVLGEGAAALVLEDLDHALRRGARIYAEVAGFGCAADAWRVTDPHPDGEGAVLAMERALAAAAVRREQVGYVNAHGTATRENDRIETRALRRVFGAAAEGLAVSSTKSMIGHLTVAAGAVEAAVTALSLHTHAVHPTVNLESPDPECDLDYVPGEARELPLEVALSSSFGFGGQCASLVFRRHPQT